MQVARFIMKETGISQHSNELVRGDLDFNLLIPGIDFIKQLMAEKE